MDKEKEREMTVEEAEKMGREIGGKMGGQRMKEPIEEGKEPEKK